MSARLGPRAGPRFTISNLLVCVHCMTDVRVYTYTRTRTYVYCTLNTVVVYTVYTVQCTVLEIPQTLPEGNISKGVCTTLSRSYNVIIVIDVLTIISHLLQGGPTFYRGARPSGPPAGYAPVLLCTSTAKILVFIK